MNDEWMWVPGDHDLAQDAEGRPVSATSPEGRRAFLEGLDSGCKCGECPPPAPPQGTDLLSRISRAEASVEACEQADLDAQQAMRIAHGEAPQFAHERTLSPAGRSAYLAFDQAAVRCSETSASLASARRILSELLQAYDTEANACRRAMDRGTGYRRIHGD